MEILQLKVAAKGPPRGVCVDITCARVFEGSRPVLAFQVLVRAFCAAVLAMCASKLPGFFEPHPPLAHARAAAASKLPGSVPAVFES